MGHPSFMRYQRKTRRHMAKLRTIEAPAEAKGQRLDLFLAAQLEGVSRSRVQLLIDQGDVLVNGLREKASLKLRGGERIDITGEPHPAPLKATAEEIPDRKSVVHGKRRELP